MHIQKCIFSLTSIPITLVSFVGSYNAPQIYYMDLRNGFASGKGHGKEEEGGKGTCGERSKRQVGAYELYSELTKLCSVHI